MLYVLTIVACFTANPRECHPFQAGAYETPMACLMDATLSVVPAWVAEHPTWTMQRWGCGAREA